MLLARFDLWLTLAFAAELLIKVDGWGGAREAEEEDASLVGASERP